MSFVEEALRKQRLIWREVVDQQIQGNFAQSLPPKNPNRIILFGVGSSFFAAKMTASILVSEMRTQLKRFRVPIIATSSVSIGVEVTPEKGDWVLAFSHRGRTPATLKALEVSARSGAFTILVASKDADFQEETASILLPTCSLEKCEPHTIGLTSAICAASTFIFESSLSEQWKKLSEQSDPDFELLKSQMKKPPTLILGEWEGEWIAREVSLKLTEMAQIRVPVYGSEEFFHGPQVLSQKLKKQENIWHISHEKDLRSSQIDATLKVQISNTSSIDWMNALVEMQWRVLAVALNLGLNPDGIT